MNSHNNLFFTESQFMSPRWQTALDAKIISYSEGLDILLKQDTSPTDIIWLLTGNNPWQKLAQAYTQRGHRVIVMTRQANLDELKSALIYGARGYLDALASVAILKQAANSVSNGALWLPANFVSNLVSLLSNNLASNTQPLTDLSALTEREKQTAELVITGLTNKAVAEQLNITERTVKAHLASVFAKLGVEDRMQLVLKMRGYKN